MTPALKPRADAKTLREANFTSDGKNTTDAPTAVARPAATTRANATPTFGLFTDMLAPYSDQTQEEVRDVEGLGNDVAEKSDNRIHEFRPEYHDPV